MKSAASAFVCCVSQWASETWPMGKGRSCGGPGGRQTATAITKIGMMQKIRKTDFRTLPVIASFASQNACFVDAPYQPKSRGPYRFTCLVHWGQICGFILVHRESPDGEFSKMYRWKGLC